jgi:hypothetical protein
MEREKAEKRIDPDVPHGALGFLVFLRLSKKVRAEKW